MSNIGIKFKPSWLVLDDILVGMSVLLFLTAHLSTQWIKGYLFQTSTTEAAAQRTFELVEANPVAELWLSMAGMAVVFSFVIMPAMILTTYIMIRQKFAKNHPWLRGQTAMFLFFVSFLNATNDVAFVAGVLSK